MRDTRKGQGVIIIVDKGPFAKAYRIGFLSVPVQPLIFLKIPYSRSGLHPVTM